MKTIVPMAGAAVGSAYGGPAGGMAGAKLGQGLVSGGADPSAVQNTAIQRRLDTPDDPNTQLAQAGAALKQMSPEDQAAYGPTISAAMQRAQQGGA